MQPFQVRHTNSSPLEPDSLGSSDAERARIRACCSPGESCFCRTMRGQLDEAAAAIFVNGNGLTSAEIDLYGRQILLPEFECAGQVLLKASMVAVIGAGGLASPLCLYLAAAGIGRLRIIDQDVVAVTNLHRQIIHDVTKAGCNKALSATEECQKRNPYPIQTFLTWNNAKELLHDADVVVDASDNARTRYVVSDACVLLRKPLVSGSALRWEGQLSVYNLTAETAPCDKSGALSRNPAPSALDGTCPCYRCVFPDPPTVNNAGTCDSEGVIGPAPGVIGVLQALETLKICLRRFDAVLAGRLLLLDCLNPMKMFRTVVLRKRRPHCSACGSSTNLMECLPNYHELLCPDFIYPTVPSELSISPAEFFTQYLKILYDPQRPNVLTLSCNTVANDTAQNVVVLDVRPRAQYKAVHIDGTLNFPCADFLESLKSLEKAIEAADAEKFMRRLGVQHANTKIFCLCRRGRDSARVTLALQRALHSICFPNTLRPISCVNVDGGLMKLRDAVPSLQEFPVI